MNKYGFLSVFMVVISIVVFLILRGPDANVLLGIMLFSSLSFAGIIFAILTKNWKSIVIGVLLNGGVLVFAFLLLLAAGISDS